MLKTNTALKDRALLVSISISGWSARKLDRKVSKEVADKHHADEDADRVGRYNKVLVAHDKLDEYQKVQSRARLDHYELTLPWGDDGWRLIAADAYERYDRMMTAHKEHLERIADEIVAAYPEMQAEAERRLGDLYNSQDYPNATAVRRKFSFWRGTDVISTSEDLRVQFSNIDHSKIAEQIDTMVNERLQTALDEPWKRIRAVLEAVAAKMESYSASKEQGLKAVMHDSIIGNVRDLVGILPLLNVTGDPELERIARDLEQRICNFDVKALKEDDLVREDARREAQALLDRMAGYGKAAA